MLADQLTEAVAEPGLAIAGVCLRGLLGDLRALRPDRGGAEFLDRAETDAVSLAQGPVDGAGLGNAHLGAVDQGRDVGGIGVPVTDETFRARGLVNGRLEDPAACGRIAELAEGLDSDARAVIAPRHSQ